MCTCVLVHRNLIALTRVDVELQQQQQQQQHESRAVLRSQTRHLASPSPAHVSIIHQNRDALLESVLNRTPSNRKPVVRSGMALKQSAPTPVQKVRRIISPHKLSFLPPSLPPDPPFSTPSAFCLRVLAGACNLMIVLELLYTSPALIGSCEMFELSLHVSTCTHYPTLRTSLVISL